MFDNALIVQSAISSFNNAALYAPAFLWVGLLCLPIFIMAWMCRDGILDRLGWRDKSTAQIYGTQWAMALAAGAVIFMAGDYSVLRDVVTTLPYVVGVVLFGLMICVGRLSMSMGKPQSRRGRIVTWMGVIALLAAGAFSGYPAWWGMLLNAGAMMGGFILGRFTRTVPNPVALGPWLVIGMATLLLMQPEYFRFGQLGNLTLGHLGMLMLTGAAAALGIAMRLVPSRGCIYQRAYVKLKWMMRVIVALGVVLFVLTESVPVFLGATALVGLLGALNIWHAEKMPQDIDKWVWCVTLMLMGLIAMMPAVTALGVVMGGALGRWPTRREWGRLL